MAVSFAGVPLPNASKIKGQPQILLNDTILIDGKHSIQATTQMGQVVTYTCLGTWAQYEAILALVGSDGTLITEDETYSDHMYISSLSYEESANPNYYFFTVSFALETAV
jgi:hypothetical protein